MSDPNEATQLDQIFSSIDKKLSLNLASEITESEIDAVYAYYAKEKFRFNQDQSQFIKPGKRSASKTTEALIEHIKNNPLSF